MANRFNEISEKAFQAQVTGLAQLLGWYWLHVSHSPQVKGGVVTRYTTPTTGPLGKGWFDLVLTREKRLIFAELKSETGKVSPEQARVHEVFRPLVVNRYSFSPGLGFNVLALPQIEMFVWKPSDIEEIERILR